MVKIMRVFLFLKGQFMAFKIALKPSYKVPVKVELPNGKGGFESSTFIAEFKRIGFDELAALRTSEQTHKEMLRDALVGFSDLLDAEDTALDFTPENVDALLNIPQAVSALSEAFWGSIYKGKEKN